MLFKKESDALGLKWRLIGWVGKLLIDFLFIFSRVRIIGYDAIAELVRTRRFIFVCWHSRLLLLSHRHKKLDASVMISNSADGEIVAQVLERQGQKAIRGSTNKGGMRALIEQINDMRTNLRPGMVVPDGPQGPRHKVQPGVILLAKKTGVPIIPLTYSSKRRKVFNSWDRFVLPMPWTRGVIIYGRPIHVPKDADENGIKTSAKELENEMNCITSRADDYFGHEFEA